MQGFGARLKQLRLEQNYNQSHIAELLGCTVSSISSYESEQRSPSYDTLIQYAQIFHVSTDYLLGLDPNKPHFDAKKRTIDVTGLADKDITALHTIIQSLQKNS